MDGEKRYCKKCGNLIDAEAVICPICNASQTFQTDNNKSKRWKALIICLLIIAGVIVCLKLVWSYYSKAEYKENYINTVGAMYDGATGAEKYKNVLHAMDD